MSRQARTGTPKRSRARPLRSLLWVPASSLEVPNRDLIGDKGLGLDTFRPSDLIPSFVVLTTECWKRGTPDRTRLDKLAGGEWPSIQAAFQRLQERSPFGVIVRPSVPGERMDERGSTESKRCRDQDLGRLLALIQEEFAAHRDRKPFALLIQEYIDGIKGHLSNEYHISRTRDEWYLEHESGRFDRPNSDVPVLLNVTAADHPRVPAWHRGLGAVARAHTDALKRWHFEWVIDGGGAPWIVQADEILPTPLVEQPCQYWLDRYATPLGSLPPPLRSPGETDYAEFSKLRPHRYFQLAEAFVPPFALLDDNATWKELRAGRVPSELEEALRQLIEGGAINIRSDIAGDGALQKNLPRSDTILTWSACKEFLTTTLRSDQRINAAAHPVLLIHRFIGARGSALAFADPSSDEAVIDSAFGLPDGLSVYAHDTAIVVGSTIRRTTRCKSHYLDATETGDFRECEAPTQLLWDTAVTDSQLLEIARIATSVAKSHRKAMCVMFFVDVPRDISPSGVLPWIVDESVKRSACTEYATVSRGLSGLEVVHDLQDLERVAAKLPRPKRVRLLPRGKDIRDRDQLKRISELARDANIAIVWQGSMLAHGWYALVDGGAVLVPVGPDAHTEAKGSADQDFNKLVRDGIPLRIIRNGERPIIARTGGDTLRVLLQQKLVEEALEVFSAPDRDELVEELADLEEVLVALRSHAAITREEVEQVRNEKRAKRGGFEEGIVLRRTTESVGPAQLDVGDEALTTVSPESLRQLTDSTPYAIDGSTLIVPRVPPFGEGDGGAEERVLHFRYGTLRIRQTAKSVTIAVEPPVEEVTSENPQLGFADESGGL